jgi:transposase
LVILTDMNRINLSDEEWIRILANLKKLTGIRVGQPDTCRQFISACLWILRSGAQWRVLPSTHGKWNSIFKRFSRWCANGAWERLLSLFSEVADLQDVSMDGSVIRAHACAAGAVNSSAENEALGRSKGGFGCKIHAICDALGMPVKFSLTGGQAAECRQAIPLFVKKRAKLSRVLGKRALKSFHSRLLNDRFFTGESWSVSNGRYCRNQTAFSCGQRDGHIFSSSL